MRLIKISFLLAALFVFSSWANTVRFSWTSISGTQIVNGSNLQDAVDNGYFSLKSGQSISKTAKAVLRSEINTWLDVDALTSDNRAVTKNELISVGPAACGTTFNFSAEPRTFTWTKNVYMGAVSGSVEFFYSMYDFDILLIEAQYEGGAWTTVASRDDTADSPYYTIHLQQSSYYSHTYNVSRFIKVRVTKNGSTVRPTSSISSILIKCPV